jgi:NADH-quinone oxidoreductase subunit L
MAPVTLGVILVVATATSFFAATIGLAQNDIKKVLAYSTVSQLGYMFMAMGVGAFMVGIFHVMTHAFFKALLFLGSGSVIHALHHEQDMTRMGGLRAKMPITAITYLIGAFAIAGFPLIFAGFFSKDEILWQVFSSPAGHPVFWAIGAITAILTAFYMFRTVALTFYGESRVDEHHAHHVHESPWTMTVPLMILAALSVVGGWLGIPHVLGGAVGVHNFLEEYFHGFFAKLPADAAHHSVTVELLLMGVSTGAALVAMYVAFRLFSRQREKAAELRDRVAVAYRVLANKYYIDELYDWLIVNPIRWCSDKVLWRIVDARIIDGAVNAAGYSTRNIGGALRLVQNGIVENYAVGIALGTIIIIWYLVF